MNVDGVVAATAAKLGSKVTDIDIEKEELGPSFKTALDTLDNFIRSNFKAEEIYNASRALECQNS